MRSVSFFSQALTAAMVLSLAGCQTLAPTPIAATPASCAAIAARAIGLHAVPTDQSLADLSITIAADQQNRLVFRGARRLEGTCADDVAAVRMSQIVFKDGAVFNTTSTDGRYTHAPGSSGLVNFGIKPASTAHPAIAQAQLIMATSVDGAWAKPSLDIGVWQTGDGYLVAAFSRNDNGFGAALALLRSTQPINSVSYFPSPDSNTGSLDLLVNSASGIALVSLFWDHIALSKTLRAGK